MLNLLIYLIVMGSTLYAATIYTGSALVFLFFLEIFYLTVASIFLLYQKRKISFRLDFPLPFVEKNQKIYMTGRIGNSGRFPIARVRVSLKYKVFGQKKVKTIKFSAMADAAQELLLETNLHGIERGSCLFKQAKLKIYDPLGLLAVRKRILLHTRLNIMPDIYKIPITVSEQIRHFTSDCDIYDNLHSGDDASELFQIRQFRNGDSLKNIHWKLSAKEQEWMVRENSRPLACGVILFFDFSLKRRKRKIPALDVFLSIGFSMSFSLAEQQCPHFVVWYSKHQADVVRMRVDDEESLYAVLFAVTEEDIGKEEKNLRMMYREKYKSENWLREIEVNRMLEIKVEGKPVAQLKEKTIGEKLEAWELRL